MLLTVAALSSPTVAARDMRLPDTTVQTSVSDEVGIRFTHKPWAEIVAQAKAENKLIFIDFYTQWCGPCLNMAETVFTLPSVGAFYNEHFVCAKIDAEHGEGVELAKKYGVRLFPTYIFVDPATEKAVHRSSSTQTAAQFVHTGECALQPETRSFYLEEQYAAGNRGRKLLLDYIVYEHSIYARAQVTKAFDELIRGGAQLTDADVWPVFADCIQSLTPYLKQVSDNYADFCARFGKEAVDAKLAKETTYGDLAAIESLCDFEGKAFNCAMIRLNDAVQAKRYDEAIERIDSLMADPATDQQQFIQRLKFVVRLSYRSEEMPEAWFNKCVECLRYIAYNVADRDDAYAHQEYADALEKLLRRLPAKDGVPAARPRLPEPHIERRTGRPATDAVQLLSQRYHRHPHRTPIVQRSLHPVVHERAGRHR